MRILIALFIAMLLSGCGSKNFMAMLSRKGDALAEGERIGKEARKISFLCGFEEDCAYPKLDGLVQTECVNYQKLEFVHPDECTALMTKVFRAWHVLNKRSAGHKVSNKKYNRAAADLRETLVPALVYAR